MRTTPIAPGEYYHIFNRSNDEQPIFYQTKDWARFLFLILHLKSPKIFFNIGRKTSKFVRSGGFNITDEIIKSRTVELVSYALMPNHFHLTVREIKENGISQYMQRILKAYPKYFNTKYNKSGHL